MIKIRTHFFAGLLQRVYLFGNDLRNFSIRERHFGAPEILAVREARVSTDRDVVFQSEFDSSPHRVGVTCMKAASDIGRRYIAHQLCVISAAFAEVTIDVYRRCHLAKKVITISTNSRPSDGGRP